MQHQKNFISNGFAVIYASRKNNIITLYESAFGDYDSFQWFAFRSLEVHLV